MAFQPFNYANIPSQGLNQFAQGMEMGMTPFKNARDAQQAMLQNALVGMQLKHYPKEQEVQN